MFLCIPYITAVDITLRERITLAWVLYRSRLRPSGVSWLARHSGFSRPTIYAHLHTLAEKGYVVHKPEGWIAVPHSKYKVKAKANAAVHWIKTICCCRVEVHEQPVKRWTEYVLYCLIVGKQIKANQSFRGLGRMLGVHRREVRRSIRNLERRNLVKATPIINEKGRITRWIVEEV